MNSLHDLIDDRENLFDSPFFCPLPTKIVGLACMDIRPCTNIPQSCNVIFDSYDRSIGDRSTEGNEVL